MYTYTLPYSGVYTINKNQPLSTTNFTSFNEAFSMIRLGTVAGAVTLNVVPGSGPYNEQLVINGPITGMNSINKITVDGGGTKEMIWFNTTISNQQAVIRIVNARNLVFKNLTINNPSLTVCAGVFLTTNADSNTIQDCNINLASTSASNSAGIAISSNGTSVTGTGFNARTTLLMGNRIRGGFYGITAYGNGSGVTTPANMGKRLSIINNFITNTYAHGINVYCYDSSEITGNTIDTCVFNSTSYYSMNVQYCDYTHIRKNKINNFYYSGMYLQNLGNAFNNGTEISRSEVSNNMIGGARKGSLVYAYPAFWYYSRNCDYFHNTVGQGSNTGGYYVYFYNTNTWNTGNEMKNNIFFNYGNTSGSYALYSYFTVNPFLNSTSFSHNDVWTDNAGASPIVFGTTAYTGNTWIGPAISGQNTSSCLNVDPQLINPMSNLHTFAPTLNDVGVNTFVTTDIDGDTRPIGGGTVDIRADEFTPPAENIGVTALVAPTQFPAGGLQDVTVTFKNFGLVAITSADVSYKAGNLGTLHTIGWTGTLAPNASTNVTFTGAMQYNNTGNNDTLISFTSNPNGTTDGYQLNDTLNSYLCGGAMAGVYTVDAGLPASSTNFQTIDAMIAKLNSCGVSAATTVNIANGTYTGQWTLTPISGVSASAPLTIQSASGNPANVTLTFNGQTSYANNHILFLNGADFIKLRNMTFTTTNATWGGLLKIIFDARDNKVEGCVFNTTASTSTLTASPSHACVDMAEGATGDNYRDTVTNCTMNNGSIGIILTAPARYNYGVVFTNNTMNNQYYAGIYHTWANSSGNPVVMSGNTITTNTSYTNFYGIYCTSSSSMLQYFNKNKVLNPNGGYGIYNTNTVAAGSQCNNNMLMVGGSSTCYPLYLSGGNWNVYNNSTMAASSLVGTYYSAYLPSSPNTIRHNIFAVSGGNACIYSPSANSVDSNIYYTTGATFGSNGTTYATFAAWKAAMPTRDLASIHSNPNFVSNTNLHLTGSSPAYTINTHPMIVDDIDNLPRCGTSQAGCDHLGGNNDIGIASLIYPPNGVASAGSQTIKVLLKNFGTNTVTSANVYYNINGTEVKQAWTGSLGLCATDTVTFTTPYTFAPGAITIKTWTDSPSTVVDSRIANDSFNINGCIGLSGAMTINASLPASSVNYQSFTAAVAAMTGCGISGPVVFTVAPGSYYEQIVIPLIPGSSAVNTVTFDGVDRNTRSINFFTGPGSEYIIRLSGTSHIYFKNLSILSSNQSVAWNVHALNCDLSVSISVSSETP
ncbi:MAG: hypothetical protein IPK03_04965 [Bacteroidetes bacterium]|nr:hypothetical protein [Bacteroidota bacterium]